MGLGEYQLASALRWVTANGNKGMLSGRNVA
jgi:hypothetical protein